MSVSSLQIALVRNSFALLTPIAPQAAAMFYANLFEANPQLRPLFRGNMAEQGEKLMQMIGAALRLLERPDQLLPVLRTLGARHAGYGVEEGHYGMVGAALVKTLAQGLGPAFSSDVRQAWLDVYDLLSRTMMDAARGARMPEAMAA